jgi:preprotein translocase subunit SecF
MKVKKTLSKGKDEKGNERLKGLGQHMKSKNSLHIKLTQAKLAAQARNLAKLAGQQKVSGNSRSTAQSKSPSQNKTAVAEKTQTQTKTLTQAKQVVQAKTPQAPKTAIQLTEGMIHSVSSTSTGIRLYIQYGKLEWRSGKSASQPYE